MKKVLLLLANGFEILEASAFIDVFGWNHLEGDKTSKLFSCGLAKEVNSSFNQKFVVDYIASEVNLDEFDALAIPGGFEEYGFYNDAYSDDFVEIIQNFNQKNKPIASICVGALALGNSGVLKGKDATTYNNPVRINSLRNFGVNYLTQEIVQVNNLITSRGPSTAMNVAFILLEMLTDAKNVENVKSLMGFDK